MGDEQVGAAARPPSGEDHHGVTRRGLLALSVAGAASVALGASACTGAGQASPSATSSALTSSGPAAVGSRVVPSGADLDRLARRLDGRLLRPGDEGWDPAALSRNARFAGQAAPAAIARCASADDVVACVEFAAAGLGEIRLRCGGHSYAAASRGQGLVVDLAGLGAVSVDTSSMTATVGAGALLVDVYAALAAQSVAIGAGSCPSVGLSGLTLGGGVGVLAPSTGLTCDQVRSARVVTADGRSRTVSATSGESRDVDVFWALRGGGSGAAAVVEWTFTVRPAPQVSTFFLQWAGADDETAGAVLSSWQAWASRAPRELWSSCRVLATPSALRAVVTGTWSTVGGAGGSAAPTDTGPGDGATALTRQVETLLRGLPAPSTRSVVTRSYGDAMLYEAGCSAKDAASCRAAALAPSGATPFAATSSILSTALPEAGVGAAVKAVSAGRSIAGLVEGGVAFDALGGAVADVAPQATAFPWRGALATVQHTATWSRSASGQDPAAFDDLVHASRSALQPWCGAGAYVNYADAQLAGSPDLARACWGENAPRLLAVRSREDPQGVFDGPLVGAAGR